MSDLKSTISRMPPGRAVPSEGAARSHAAPRPAIALPRRPPQGVEARGDQRTATTAPLSDFIAPPAETAEWLGSPAIGSVLAAVSRDLAPDGVAMSKRNQYAASVVETHMVARRQLTRHLNALLRA